MEYPAHTCQGTGFPVVLLHGWGGNRDSMAPVGAALRAAGFSTLAVDMPGHGQTPPPKTPWNVDDYAAELYALLDHLQIRRCHIVGHSFGGRVALMTAAKHPEMVSRMVLTGCAGLRPKRGAGYYAKVYSYKLSKRLLAIGAVRAVCQKLGVDVQKRMSRAGSADYQAITDPVFKQTFVRVVNQDLTPLLPNIAAPTLLLWGRRDTATPLWMGKKMAAIMPDAALVELDGGHFAYLEQAQQFNHVTTYFFAGDESPRKPG